MNKHTPSLRTLNAMQKRMVAMERRMVDYYVRNIDKPNGRIDGSFLMAEWMDGFNYAMKLARKIAKEKP